MHKVSCNPKTLVSRFEANTGKKRCERAALSGEAHPRGTPIRHGDGCGAARLCPPAAPRTERGGARPCWQRPGEQEAAGGHCRRENGAAGG